MADTSCLMLYTSIIRSRQPTLVQLRLSSHSSNHYLVYHLSYDVPFSRSQSTKHIHKHAVALLIVLGLAFVRLLNVEPTVSSLLTATLLFAVLDFVVQSILTLVFVNVYLGQLGLDCFTFLLCYVSKFRRSKRPSSCASWLGCRVFIATFALHVKRRQSPDPEYLTCVSNSSHTITISMDSY
jgi:hypothetical protein